MNKTVTVEVDVEPNLQQDVEQILGGLGLSVNQAIANILQLTSIKE